VADFAGILGFMSHWETLDIAALLAAREAQQEATASANVGSYPVPLGGVLRRDYPYGVGGPSPYHACHGTGFCDLETEWQLYGDDPLQRRR
jgi:hypothetical protein